MLFLQGIRAELPSNDPSTLSLFGNLISRTLHFVRVPEIASLEDWLILDDEIDMISFLISFVRRRDTMAPNGILSAGTLAIASVVESIDLVVVSVFAQELFVAFVAHWCSPFAA
jgi:hypothetical protein